MLPGPTVSITLPIDAAVSIIDGEPIVIIPTSPAPIVNVTQPPSYVSVQMGQAPVNVEMISNPIMLPLTATDPTPVPGPPGPSGVLQSVWAEIPTGNIDGTNLTY